MNERLPLKQIFMKGIKMPIENYKELLRLGWPYAAIILVSSFIFQNSEGVLLYFSFLFGLCVTGVLGAIGCHRVFLLPSQTVAETSTFRWGSRETNFLLSIIGISILGTIISIPFYAIIFYLDDLEFFVNDKNTGTLKLIYLLLFMPATYIISRWSLVLPDTAVDNDNTFSWAWNISSGHSIRLFVLIGAIPLFTNLIFEFIGALFEPSNVLSLLQNIIWLVVTVIEICLLSLSYEWITSN